MNALGYTLADRTDKKDEALSLIQNALKLKPDEPAIIDSLGWAHYRLGHLDDAVKQLRTAYSKQPDAEIAAHLGEVLWVSGQKDEAKKVWEQGRKKDGKNKVLLETIKRLSS
jgi:Flp pilus assembly protein TadD